MKYLVFKPEDFMTDQVKFTSPMLPLMIADLANKKLEKLIGSWPVVYGDPNTANTWNDSLQDSDTRQARLVFIEEIVKEPCVHEPMEDLSGFNFDTNFGNSFASTLRDLKNRKPIYKCKHCGVELQATWSEKK